MKFKVGNKVKTKYGVGKVVYVGPHVPYLVGIHGLHGHSGHMFVNSEIAINAGYKNECCWFRERELEPVKDDTEIVISRHGKEVRAEFKINGKIVKESVAQCHPDDRFNFKTGAQIAFERLFEKEKVYESFRETLKREHPEYVQDIYTGGCFLCPCEYGYEDTCPSFCNNGSEELCRKCWDRKRLVARRKEKTNDVKKD